ncbi:molybdate-transporting ATPase [Acididesulfobacillus acetoxydans]|uniref:Bacterial extracellular solute-binding protein, family 5, conserved site n=1 Tax=Acididesulfobacillus acetoxydans TaxID=1561005 RepID=A0A8S0W1U8_9FIRM|nr:molybdate ABC transporter substrate-binding protein [Acididesulfobacillus acetoxydans]CAA7599948.1 molybdate-transporting ATPase [Acididesulfobacillus acetoxydans]CEJ07960.1 Bacterial extracellular solute-binding protein, family 5, conserved site [Acididesulfobacillus acetoxydans]
MVKTREASETTEIRAAAGAGLRHPLSALEKVYQKLYPQHHLQCTFAGAGELCHWIQEGSGHDVIILPEAGGHLDNLESSGFLDAVSRRQLLRDHLVLLLNRELPGGGRVGLEWLTAPEVKTVAIGKPGMAPLGDYTVESLQNLGLWEKIAGKIMYDEINGHVPAYVEENRAQAGIAFGSCAAAYPDVPVAADLPQSSYHKVYFDIALLNRGKNTVGGEHFWRFLQSGEAREVFAACGLTWCAVTAGSL